MKGGLSAIPRKIERRWQEYYARLTRLLIENKLFPGNGEYTKFIILTRARSGSNFLVDMLNSHENIVCFSELFSRSGQTLWGVPGYNHLMSKSSPVARLKESDPIRFLSRYVYTDHPRRISAVGFKLLYNQAHKGMAEGLWQYLRELDDLKVIHLKRRNLLKVLVSTKIASGSGVWVMRDNAPAQVPQGRVKVSHEECMALFDRTREQQQKYDGYFSGHALTELVYEDLLADTEVVMDHAQEFLGVDKRKLVAHTRKQSTRPLSEVISNYSELRESFAGTEWEMLFE